MAPVMPRMGLATVLPTKKAITAAASSVRPPTTRPAMVSLPVAAKSVASGTVTTTDQGVDMPSSMIGAVARTTAVPVESCIVGKISSLPCWAASTISLARPVSAAFLPIQSAWRLAT